MVYKTLCELNKMYCIYIVHVIYYIIYNIVYTVSFSKAGFSQVAVNQVFLFFLTIQGGCPLPHPLPSQLSKLSKHQPL